MVRKKEEVADDCIRVCTRFRPQNGIEKRNGGKVAIQVSPDESVARLLHPRQNLDFVFDRVFNIDSTQPKVYEFSVAHMIEQVMNGYNCTVFAYGQTGSGKTYSMEGSIGSPIRGIVPRLVENLFDAIEEADEVYEFVVKISYVEIYLERLRDLLKPSNPSLRIRESKHGVYIQGVTEMYVRDGNEVINLMQLGARNRTVNSTNMNAVSSRSHGVFMLKLVTKDTNTGSTKMAKLMMVDLAGSEKVRKTGATGALLEEAKKINLSLTCLGSVMCALSEGQPFIPYRDSVLTRILSDSLGGNCKTTLIVCASCSNWNLDETVSTLRFGTRAKKVKNKAKVNAEKTAAEYKRELAAAKAKIAALQRLVTCLKRDLKMACEGKLTNPADGTAAHFEKGEDIDLGEEEATTQAAPAARDPWAAIPTVQEESDEEIELIEEDESDEEATSTTINSGEEQSGNAPEPSANAPEAVAPVKNLNELGAKDVEGDLDFESAADLINENQELIKGDEENPGRDPSLQRTQKKLTRQASRGGKRDSIKVKSSHVTQLVQANDALTEKYTELRQSVAKLRTDLMMKAEALIKEKEKTEEAESQYERALVDARVTMDEAVRLKYERERLTRERDDIAAELVNAKSELEKWKNEAELLKEKTEDSLEQVRSEERAKVDEFIAQARSAISDRAPAAQGAISNVLSNSRFGGPSSGMSGDQEFRQMKLDKVKLEQTLQQKVQAYVQMKLEMMESKENVKKLEDSVKRKDMRLRGQHNELVGLGELKKEADKYHFETTQKLEKELKKMKRDNASLKKQVETLRGKQNELLENTDFERDEAPAAVKKKLKSMVLPLRGGGKKKKKKKNKKLQAAPTGNTLAPNMNAPQFNSFHAKSPSMMNQYHLPPPQSMIYQPQYDIEHAPNQAREDVLAGEIPEVPQVMGGFYPAPQGYDPNFDHGRNNTFMNATNFWPAF